ncbi:hypothetical protein D3C87_2018890 [compost metagenome]
MRSAQADDRHHSKPNRGRIDDSPVAGDEAPLFKPLQTFRRRRLREADPPSKLGNADASVVLQDFDHGNIRWIKFGTQILKSSH